MASIPLSEGFPFALRQYTGNGTNRIFSVDFPRLSDLHVKVYLDGVVQSAGFSFNTPSSIEFVVAPANGVEVVIRRQTPAATPIVVYENPSTLKAANLNTTSLQLLYIAQEQADLTLGDLPVLDDIATALAQALQAAEDAQTALDAAIAAQLAAEQAETNAEAAQAATEALLLDLQANYDVVFSTPFRPSNGEVYGTFTFVRDAYIPAGAPGSGAATDSQGTTTGNFSILKNGLVVGSGTIVGNSTAGTVTVASQVDFGYGDVLSLRWDSGDPNTAARHSVAIRTILET